ncbi:MAG: hypothetical protein DRQ51_10585 [Gammaproteobacteria bacterium]|nr:MAG: hypothetical protein DRQ51_10585 [Gammaproteobacteria bacterium]
MPLIATPHNDGNDILKDKLYSIITKFALVDVEDEVYFVDDLTAVFFDADGFLCLLLDIPIEIDFTKLNQSVQILTNEDVIVATVETPQVVFAKNIGGSQLIKIEISGKVARVFFKKDDYLTLLELEEIHCVTDIQLAAGIISNFNFRIKKTIEESL